MTALTLIFSKDRPLQLHGTLASFALHCREHARTPVAVLYRASTPACRSGYEQLQREFSGCLAIDWIEERAFQQDLLRQLEGTPPRSRQRRLLRRLGLDRPRLLHEHLLFLVDDNLFVRPFSLDAIGEALRREPQAIGFSLRVGRNTTSCYSMRCAQPVPEMEPAAHGLKFTWAGQAGDFGYPLEVSSSVYRSADLIPLLRSLPYSNPNRLEQGLAAASRLFTGRLPLLLCMEQSVAFCAPVNKVQTILDNRAGESEAYSSEALNGLFLAGQRINVEALRDFVPQAAHVEIELPLHRPGPA